MSHDVSLKTEEERELRVQDSNPVKCSQKSGQQKSRTRAEWGHLLQTMRGLMPRGFFE